MFLSLKRTTYLFLNANVCVFFYFNWFFLYFWRTKSILLYIECSSDYYGMNCNERCSGHCINNKPCHHVSGECSNGCKDGYIGLLCNDGKKYSFLVKNKKVYILIIAERLFVRWTKFSKVKGIALGISDTIPPSLPKNTEK